MGMEKEIVKNGFKVDEGESPRAQAQQDVSASASASRTPVPSPPSLTAMAELVTKPVTPISSIE